MDTYSLLNDPKHIFVIAEAGSNWKSGSYSDDLNQAKRLIDVAKSSGADAVKFQTYKPETVYVPNAGTSNYLQDSGISDQITEIFKHHAMPYKMIPELSNYCKNQNIHFMSSPFSVQDAKEIDPFVEFHKVASFEINHVRLLEYLSQTKKPIIISTGASTLDEIDFAVDYLKNHGNTKIALLQCTSKYPSPLNSLNLGTIPKLKERYKVPVGFSDHSVEPTIAPVVSVVLGSTIIEKHITLNKNLPGPDHSFALEPSELNLMVKSIRDAETSIGNGIKDILPVEKELRNFATRSLQATQNIKKGDLLIEGQNFDVLRPGNQPRGLGAKFLEQVNGKKALRDYKVGEGINKYE